MSLLRKTKTEGVQQGDGGRDGEGRWGQRGDGENEERSSKCFLECFSPLCTMYCALSTMSPLCTMSASLHCVSLSSAHQHISHSDRHHSFTKVIFARVLSRSSVQGNQKCFSPESTFLVQKFSSGESPELHRWVSVGCSSLFVNGHRWVSVSHECVHQYIHHSAGHMGVRYID